MVRRCPFPVDLLWSHSDEHDSSTQSIWLISFPRTRDALFGSFPILSPFNSSTDWQQQCLSCDQSHNVSFHIFFFISEWVYCCYRQLQLYNTFSNRQAKPSTPIPYLPIVSERELFIYIHVFCKFSFCLGRDENSTTTGGAKNSDWRSVVRPVVPNIC